MNPLFSSTDRTTYDAWLVVVIDGVANCHNCHIWSAYHLNFFSSGHMT